MTEFDVSQYARFYGMIDHFEDIGCQEESAFELLDCGYMNEREAFALVIPQTSSKYCRQIYYERFP